MKTICMCLLLGAAVNSLADENRPVVQILGRTESDRPVTAVTPQAVQVQGTMTPPIGKGDAPAAVSESAGLVMPVGAIVAWANAFTNLPPMLSGWVPCHGQTITDTDSPLCGQSVPNLNGMGGEEGRFLRGGPVSGPMGGSSRHSHDGYRSQKYGTQRSPVASPVPANHLPPYFDVVWIIRIK